MSTKCKAAIILVMLAAAVIGLSCTPALAQYNTGFRAPGRTITPGPIATGPTIGGGNPIAPHVNDEVIMDPPEYRCSEVYGFASEFANPTATSIMIDKLYTNNFNVVMPEIRKQGDAYYNSAYEPWATDVAGGYDPLADILTKAHDRNMQVFGWIVTYRIWPKGKSAPSTHIWSKHPDWAMIDNVGRNFVGNYYNLDPGIPGVEDYVVGVVKDIVAKYPTLDGFNFDYIRYDSTAVGYNPISKARFKSEYGFDPPMYADNSNPQWQAWSEWKRRQITDLVKRCYVEAMAINPKIKMTADTIGWMGANPVTDFESTRAYTEVCQDSKGWLNQHFLDIIMLMNYKRDWTGLLADSGYRYKGYGFGDQQSDHRLWSDYLKQTQDTSGRHCIDTIGGYMNMMQGILDQWGYSRNNGLGLSMFRYGFDLGQEDPNNPGLPVFNPGTSTVAGPTAALENTFYDTITSTMFQNPAPVPAMPWKDSPTTGYLFGQVTDSLEPNDPVYQNWMYKAAVTAVGPASAPQTYTAQTDATGTYEFIDLPPGTYSVTVSQPGYADLTMPATVTVGLATRLDLQLGPVVLPANYKDLKQMNDPVATPDNTIVGVTGKVVTSPLGTFSDCIYIEEPGRESGLQVKLSSGAPSLLEGDVVSLTGKIATSGGERVLTHAAVTAKASGTALTPVGSNTRDLSRTPSSTDVLVKVAGKVVDSGSGWFVLADGSGTIKVRCAGILAPVKGTSAQAIGINCVDTTERFVRVRKAADITLATKTAVTSPAGTIGVGLNLFSLPFIATDPTPTTALTGITIPGMLFRWDTSTQTFVGYDAAVPSVFGNMGLNDGFALLSTTTGVLTFEGVPGPTADARISCPSKGWNLLACPFNAPVLWDTIKVTDGTQTLSLADAVAAHWIGRIAFTWDSQSGNFGYVGTGARGSRFDDSLRPWKAYWISTYQDNLAIIVPPGS